MIKSLYRWAISQKLPLDGFKEIGNTSQLIKVLIQN